MATSQGIKLDTDTQARLRALADKRDRTPHWLMRTAIERYLDQEERYEQEKSEDMARWERYVETGEAIDHDQVETWLNELAQNKPTPWRQ
jgi:predicted transcriptional regulator